MGKNGKKYECLTCNFNTLYKSNFQKHLLTAKHTLETSGNKKMGKNGTPFICCCGKKYKTRSGLWKHKSCCIKNDSTVFNKCDHQSQITKPSNKDQLILDLLAQNKELINILNETIPKIGNTTNNTTNNNNNFNLQVFLNEDCKDAINFSEFIDNIKISFEDLENQAEIGYVNGISKLFIENLQILGTYKRPIHCTDKKRKTLYIKENNEWDKEGSQDKLKKGINILSIKSQEKLIQEKHENQEEYNDINSEFSEKCISIQRNLYPDVPRETAINKVIENISKNSGVVE